MLLEHDPDFASLSKKQQQDLQVELARIETDGVYVQSNILIDGVTDVATLIGQPQGKVIASLAVSSLNSKLGKQLEQNRLITHLTDTAKIITEQLGC